MRPSASARLSGLVGLSLAFGACAFVTPRPDASPSRVEAMVAPHRARAEALERSGDLRAALDEWKIALTIAPDDAHTRASKATLEARIAAAVARRISQGREALRRGAPLEARRQFLAVLALDPADREAFDALQNDAKDPRSVPPVRGRETRETAARPWARPSEEATEVNPLLLDAREAFEQKEYHVALADVNRVLDGSPRHAQAIELKKTILYEYGKSQLDQKQHADAHRTLTELAALDVRYRNTAPFRGQARARLTQDLYNEGIRRYREEDLEGAIALWRVVLAYDPDHADARRNIEQAERVLRELERRHEEAK